MAPTNRDDLKEITKRVGEKHGPAAAKALSTVLTDPDFQDEVLLMSPGPREDAARSSLDLHGYVIGKLDRSKLAAAFRGTVFGVHERLPLRVIAQEDVPSRPTEPRFIEALRGLCGAKRHQPVKMANADFDLGQLEEETAQIEVLRAVTQIAVRFTSTLLRNLAVREDAAWKTMKQAYSKVREAARADDALTEHLAPTEEYLFGPAQQAAETRARMDVARKDAFAAGEQQALRTAERNVRDSLADEIVSLSDDLRHSAERGRDDRNRPR